MGYWLTHGIRNKRLSMFRTFFAKHLADLWGNPQSPIGPVVVWRARTSRTRPGHLFGPFWANLNHQRSHPSALAARIGFTCGLMKKKHFSVNLGSFMGFLSHSDDEFNIGKGPYSYNSVGLQPHSMVQLLLKITRNHNQSLVMYILYMILYDYIICI
jgi:hypothetical protein